MESIYYFVNFPDRDALKKWTATYQVNQLFEQHRVYRELPILSVQATESLIESLKFPEGTRIDKREKMKALPAPEGQSVAQELTETPSPLTQSPTVPTEAQNQLRNRYRRLK